MHESLAETSASKPLGFQRGDSAHLQTHERPRTCSARNNPFDLANADMLTPPLQPAVLDDEGKPLIRVHSNKFPMLKHPLESAALRREGSRRSMVAAGAQEVVIQHWRYDYCQALGTAEECAALWRVLQQRSAQACAHPAVRYAQVMENHGPRSGASLPHAHAQVLALPFVPSGQRRRLALAREAHRRAPAPPGAPAAGGGTTRRPNPFDVALDEAREDGRVLVENDACAALVPYAQDRPYEVWVVSKCPDAPSLEREPRIEGCAEGVRRALKMLYQERSDPSYNLLVRQCGTTHEAAEGDDADDDMDGEDDDHPEQWYRWHVVILPHFVGGTWAGIKGYGDFIPVKGTPEDHAERLRAWLHRPFEHEPKDLKRESSSQLMGRGRSITAAVLALFLATALLMPQRSSGRSA